MSNKSRNNEILGIIIVLLSIIIFLSLISYDIADYEKLSKNLPVENIIGPVGAALSNLLRSAFGYSSYIIFMISAFLGWAVLSGKNVLGYMERIFSFTYLLITTSALTALFFQNIVPQFSGGFIGLYLVKLFQGITGKAGAYLLVIFLNLIGLVLLGALSLSTLLSGEADENNLFSRAMIYLRKKFFLIKNRERIPVNRIDEAIKTVKRKKPPWITKKKVKFYKKGKPFRDDDIVFKHPRLIELKEPETLDNINLAEIETHLSSELFKDDDHEPSNETELFGAVSADEKINFEPAEKDFAESQPGQPCWEEDGDSRIIMDGIEVNRIKFIDDEDSPEKIFPADNHTSRKGSINDAVENEEPSAGELFHEDQDFDGPGDEGQEYLDEFYNGNAKVFGNIEINSKYSVPTSFLQSSGNSDTESWQAEIKRNSELLVNTLRDFGIESRVIKVNRGPVITLYEMQIAPGIKVNKIVGLSDDIAMALAASRVRIVAPIPGKSAIGVEVPNLDREIVTLGDVIKSQEYETMPGRLKVALGEDILGKPITLDLKRLPHLLIAGATGSGKSVLVNTIITSLIYNYDPNYVKFIMVDPKMVELQLYNGLPHLLTPVITEPHVAPKALKWAMMEMERRYRLLSHLNTRGIEKYNEKIKELGDEYERLPYIVIIMDELADLMMVASKEIEGYITRIAQKARAVGIHLVLATQRPSVNIITGIIKANFPARIAFQVAQKIDSRTIIDQNGAEKLVGAGDMLYQSPLSSFPVRIQSAYISENEIMDIVTHLKKMGRPMYIDIEEAISEEEEADEAGDFEDELFTEALKIVEETRKASASYLQRRLSIGYNRAARIIEMMEDKGYIGQQQGSRPREVFL